jgi:hypothetical protein
VRAARGSRHGRGARHEVQGGRARGTRQVWRNCVRREFFSKKVAGEKRRGTRRVRLVRTDRRPDRSITVLLLVMNELASMNRTCGTF